MKRNDSRYSTFSIGVVSHVLYGTRAALSTFCLQQLVRCVRRVPHRFLVKFRQGFFGVVLVCCVTIVESLVHHDKSGRTVNYFEACTKSFVAHVASVAPLTLVMSVVTEASTT